MSDRPAGNGSTAHSVAYPQVVAGANFTAALAADGTVWTWGANDYGQLGIGELYGTYAGPQQVIQVNESGNVTPLNNVRKIAAAGNFVIALKNDGTVWVGVVMTLASWVLAAACPFGSPGQLR